MNFQTTKQHEEFRAKVRAFAESEVKPVAFLLDKENRCFMPLPRRSGDFSAC